MNGQSNDLIAVIPARGGSQGIEKKNIRMFAGAPLICHTIEQALSANMIDRVVVSTDDEEIAGIAENSGAEFVFRPKAISGHTATSESALLHTLDYLEDKKNATPDYIAFLQCTSPLRQTHDLDAAFRKLLDDRADSLLSVTKSHRFVWEKSNGSVRSVNYDYRNRPRRQDFQEQYIENGSIYICKSEMLKKQKNRLGGKITMYEMEPWQAFEIDDWHDLKLCEWLYQQHVQKFVVTPKEDNKVYSV